MKTIVSNIRILVIAGTLAVPVSVSAATAEAASTPSLFSNPLFNTMLIMILILALMIVVLSNALKNILQADFMNMKFKKHSEASSRRKDIGLMILFSGVSLKAVAAESAAKVSSTIGGLDKTTFYIMAVTIAAELLVLGILFYTFKGLLAVGEPKKVKALKAVPVTATLLKKLTDTVDVDKEADIVLDHEYDGIRELDNNLPPWWKYGFYLTILVAVVYMINYHVIKTAPLQAEEYTRSVKQAEAEVAEYMKTSANNVDETSVKLLTAEGDLQAGKDLYLGNCAACHGRAGEGTVGPNLTDDYWLHGGGVKDVFKTIKYGWPDKGMKSWKDDFSPIQIAQITSFLRTFKGTNPTNPKEKQGELYVETDMPSDSAAVPADTLKTLSQKLP